MFLLDYKFNSINFLDIFKKENNEFKEKLEFLGDGLINNFIVSSVYKKFFSTKKLGQIARIKSLLISKNNLSLLTEKLNLLPDSLKNKSVKKKSDILEIFFGAVYLDSSYSLDILKDIYNKNLEPILFDIMENDLFLDFKTILQTYTQKDMKILPKYTIMEHSIKKKEHNFLIKLTLQNFSVFSHGNCLLNAEQNASKFLVNFLKINYQDLY